MEGARREALAINAICLLVVVVATLDALFAGADRVLLLVLGFAIGCLWNATARLWVDR